MGQDIDFYGSGIIDSQTRWNKFIGLKGTMMKNKVVKIQLNGSFYVRLRSF